MKIQLAETGTLKNIITALNKFIAEGMFRSDSEGLTCKFTDPTMVADVGCKIPVTSTIFEVYEAKEQKDFKVNLDMFAKILGRAGATDKVELTLEENTLNVLIEGTRTKEFKIPLLDITEEDTTNYEKVLDVKYEGKAKLNSDVLKDMLEDVSIVDESVWIIVSPTAVVFKSGDQMMECRTEILSTSDDMDEINYKKEMKSRLATSYISKTKEILRMCDTFSMENGDDYPLRLTFDMPDKAEVTVTIAPRVDD